MDRECPFPVRRYTWGNSWLIVTKVQEDPATNYGKAWGEYWIKGKFGGERQVRSAGSYQWEHYRVE